MRFLISAQNGHIILPLVSPILMTFLLKLGTKVKIENEPLDIKKGHRMPVIVDHLNEKD